jgi:hypothetical protein
LLSKFPGLDLPGPTVEGLLVIHIRRLSRERAPPESGESCTGLGDVGVADPDVRLTLNREQVPCRDEKPKI